MILKAPYSNDVIEAADNLMHLCYDGRDEFDWTDCQCCEYYTDCELLDELDKLQSMD